MNILPMILDPSFRKNCAVNMLHTFSERDQVIASACLTIHSEFHARYLSNHWVRFLVYYKQTIWGQLLCTFDLNDDILGI